MDECTGTHTHTHKLPLPKLVRVAADQGETKNSGQGLEVSEGGSMEIRPGLWEGWIV